MKNLHILPTDKPSRLHYSKVKTENEIAYKLILKSELSKCNDGLLSSQRNIYITSDEEFKDGYFINCDMICKFDESKVSKEWITDEFVNGYSLKTNVYYSFETDKCKKIILTTDQDLIKDGVQAIDDEFLEWFVKNPSCEEVEVDKVDIEQPKPLYSNGNHKGERIWFESYKIIIPKEKPKPEYSKIKEGLKKSIEGKEHFIQHFKNGGSVEDFKPLQEPQQETLENIIQDIATHLNKTVPETLQHIKEFSKELDKLKSKQETLEEAAENYVRNEPDATLKLISKYSFKDGAKWQSERMYSEQEVMSILINSLHSVELKDNKNYSKIYNGMKEWFEQNKKK